MHPQLKKYTTWLMSDETNEAAGQISPSLSLMGAMSHFVRKDPARLVHGTTDNGALGARWHCYVEVVRDGDQINCRRIPAGYAPGGT